MRALQKLYDKGVNIKRPRAVTVVGRAGAVGKGKGVKVGNPEALSPNPEALNGNAEA